MKKVIIIFSLFLIAGLNIFAQVAISVDNSDPDPSAMLDVKSTSKGALLPRMTQSQVLAIQNPAIGLIVFCTTDSKLYVFVSSSAGWKELTYGNGKLGTPLPCGFDFTINHSISAVAPVNKTATYTTVTGIPGEPNKCWITRNLGAGQQATAVNDASEAAAGWYWQFNRKQGFKHDGVTLTPNSAWVSSISESSDWLSANDPCSLELGSAWRLPTPTEWSNVDNAGGWSNWNGPWNSELKMHAAGYIQAATAMLNSRGSNGYYWGSIQNNLTSSWLLSFSAGSLSVISGLKANAFPLRCIRD